MNTINYIDFYDACYNFNITRYTEFDNKMSYFKLLKHYLDNLNGKKYLIQILNKQQEKINSLIINSFDCGVLSDILSYFNDLELDILLKQIQIISIYRRIEGDKKKYNLLCDILSREIIRFRTLRMKKIYKIIIDVLLRKYKNETYLNKNILSYL